MGNLEIHKWIDQKNDSLFGYYARGHQDREEFWNHLEKRAEDIGINLSNYKRREITHLYARWIPEPETGEVYLAESQEGRGAFPITLLKTQEESISRQNPPILEIITEKDGKDIDKKDIIEVKGVKKSLENVPIIKELTFTVPKGIIFGLIGPSGSGKTTVVRLLNGIYKPDSGKIHIMGHQPHRFSHHIKARIGYMPQQFILYPYLSIWENMNFVASLYGMDKNRQKRLNELLEFVELSHHKKKRADQLSGGMLRRLSLASALIQDPDILYLDEPTTGIDPVLRSKFWEYFKQLQADGKTLIVTTQYLGEITHCDLIGVMRRGKLMFTDSPEGIRYRAMVGEIIELQTQKELTEPQITMLNSLPFIKEDITQIDRNCWRIVVEKANQGIPSLLEWCRQQGISVISIEEHFPPFDDIFVKIIRKEEGNHA